MNNCIVIIPIYKEQPSINELISFKNNISKCSKRNICLLTYKELDIQIYLDEIKEIPINIYFYCQYFDSSYFSGIPSYNRLMTLPKFYEVFKEYDYMLLCQLDVYIFKDNLNYWMSKGYDFIGPPLMTKDSNGNPDYWKVGNGGFSLRKVSTFKDVLTTYSSLFQSVNYNYKSFILQVKSYFAYLRIRKNNLKPFSKDIKNEDIFFSKNVSKSWKHFKVPSIEEARSFGFDEYPKKLYNDNQEKLPMGVHAWWRFEYDFWKEIIDNN
ncbi:DUF5672 family protein [Flammeovirga kamogawensis]|uniref:DUF5672 domain-containing protein n=1 Tax=Flammeovirga kamogawensis TaxID=373891 RepID=A0ABX8GT47_9BACT|nr:DUF5672 family protein [Flammeovirga kamogawensis]MBB6462946.1 hypothetical protein [Flammeovirga kamogawensis]QWG06473.1 hypothetical protein KM029_14185 [Flammeovirga kamogawensis]TRX68302.1 hypothetical protein EO216_09200 [Flammeovirga kamogawensis]